MSVSAETLPSVWIFLFCCAQDISGYQRLGSGPQSITAPRVWGAGLYKNNSNRRILLVIPLSCEMLQYIHQFANCVCLLFGAGSVVCSGFIRAFFFTENAADCCGWKWHWWERWEWIKATLKCSGESGDNSLWVCLWERPLLHYTSDPLLS